MEDLFAAIQPGSDGGSGAPPAPEPPAAPAPEPPAADPPAESAGEDAEWGKAIDNIFPGVQDDKKEEDKSEQPDPPETSKKVGEDQGTPPPEKSGEDAGKPPESGEKEDDGGESKTPPEDEPVGPPELSASDRQALETSVKTEIQEKMFVSEVNGKQLVTTPDGSKYRVGENGKYELTDADGDPIRTIDDLMKLVNPRTQQPFTEEQAGMWLLNANNQMRENISDMRSQIDSIAATGLTMKEESEVVAWQYGELLKAMPDLQKELWTEYEQTLVKDPKTGIVTKAPMSLQRFYERSLEPYAALARKLESDASQSPTAPAAPPQPTKEELAQTRQQRREDRSDIYGGGKIDDTSDEDKEWGMAAQNVFGDQLNDLRRK